MTSSTDPSRYISEVFDPSKGPNGLVAETGDGATEAEATPEADAVAEHRQALEDALSAQSANRADAGGRAASPFWSGLAQQ